mmetsp:Transcript_2097/g.7686  ORF Transcript_2097/g.7686 Transcript_2097/m.7686 type:complete len:83 (+) Transcript_2097:438-686(+)
MTLSEMGGHNVLPDHQLREPRRPGQQLGEKTWTTCCNRLLASTKMAFAFGDARASAQRVYTEHTVGDDDCRTASAAPERGAR